MSWERDEASERVSEPHDRRPEESDPNAVVPPAPKMSDEDHRRRHAELHHALDELVADWLQQTSRLPSGATVLELMRWSHSQAELPDHPAGG